jgi:hypothetical protein
MPMPLRHILRARLRQQGKAPAAGQGRQINFASSRQFHFAPALSCCNQVEMSLAAQSRNVTAGASGRSLTGRRLQASEPWLAAPAALRLRSAREFQPLLRRPVGV